MHQLPKRVAQMRAVGSLYRGFLAHSEHESSVHCEELISLPKSMLTRFISRLDRDKLGAVDRALAVALDLEA